MSSRENITRIKAIYNALGDMRDQGKNDGRLSSDFENIVYLPNNRNALFEEMEAHLKYNEQSRADVIINSFKEINNSR